MTDESLEHALKAVEIRVGGETVLVDRDIAPLVEALNRLPGVCTLASCQGHASSEFDKRAYVMFDWQGATLWLSVYPDQLPQAVAFIEVLCMYRAL